MKPAVAKIVEKTQARRVSGKAAHPVLILTIANGAGHTQAAKAIASAWQNLQPDIPARVVEVSEYMSPFARFTHVTAYLWLVKNAPAVWEKIDSYQKRQMQTSPTWFYRRECRKLFDLAREIEPSAIVATEVGCGEIAALIKRDLSLDIPFVAVNVNYDADRAWIQTETDFYCLVNDKAREDFVKLGASPEKIAAWGVPMQTGFAAPSEDERKTERRIVGEWLDLPFDAPLILVAGGGEGLGKIEEIARKLLESESSAAIVVLAGNNKKLKENCETLRKTPAAEKRLRVLGWTNRVPQLFRAADILISKLGNTFDEAMTCGLPIIALEPPPGAERIQYNLLENYGVGRALRSLEEISKTVGELLGDKDLLRKMRAKTASFGNAQAAAKLADWLRGKIND